MQLSDFRAETEPANGEQEDYEVRLQWEDDWSEIGEIRWDHNERIVWIEAAD